MEALWALGEFAWAGAVLLGVGAAAGVGVLVTRRWRTVNERRLAYDAARDDLRRAELRARETRQAVKVARAEAARLYAARSASQATGDEVAHARRALRQAEREEKAAAAEVRAFRVRVRVARAEMPLSSASPDRQPLARVRAAHDAVTARWMTYETDPGLAIAYPTMSDARDPATAAFLRAVRRAAETRPAPDARVTPAEFSAYRDAVADLERAFGVAEHAARARANGQDPTAPAWQDSAQRMLSRSAEVMDDTLDRATSFAASAIDAWLKRRRPDRGDDDRA